MILYILFMIGIFQFLQILQPFRYILIRKMQFSSLQIHRTEFLVQITANIEVIQCLFSIP